MRKPSKLIFTESGNISIEGWLSNLNRERSATDHTLLREACVLAQIAGEEHATPNGEACLHQGLAMAEILADLSLDDVTLAGAVIYSSVQHADLKLEDVNEHLGQEVAKLIQGTQQMDAVHALHGKLTQGTHVASTIDNLRKMLLAMVEDVRVVLIKLAERLCILRNILILSEKEVQRLAQETMTLYAPLANRLGIGHLKWQLEDMAFRYLEPENYHDLSKKLNEKRIDREHYVKNFAALLKKSIGSTIEGYEVTGRAKHIYSIYKKMERKKVELSEIYDSLAFRILVSTIDDCYLTLSLIHSLWQSLPQEFDDYISMPKPNGYRSIHTAIEGPEGKHIEIQIRTYDMHREAELGVAAHWVYKEGRVQKTSYEQKIAWLRQVLDWQKEMTRTDNQEVISHIFDDRLYVFTPSGDVIDLPSGATPLDFAYQIHSELGHRCRGAKVNGVIVPLTYSLKTGEKVEILTTKQGHPSRDWLNPHLGYLKTSRAKAKVSSWFRKQEQDRNLDEGHDLLEKELRRIGVREIPYDDLARQLNYSSKEEMFIAIGVRDLRMNTVLSAVHALTQGGSAQIEAPIFNLPEAAKIKSNLPPTDIIIEGVGNLLTYLAGCCKPIPGDDIVGYVTMGRGISIHRLDCQNLQERVMLYPDRKIEVSWGNKTHRHYPVALNIVASDRKDLLQELTSLLANEHVPLIAVNMNTHPSQNIVILNITIEVDSIHPLSRILGRICQLPGVREAHRD